MAVFPDRIVLKNSTDSRGEIEKAINAGGTAPIQQGELVVGRESGAARLYALDSTGKAVVVDGPIKALEDLSDVVVSRVWFSGFESGEALPTLVNSTVTTEQAYSGTQSLKGTSSGLTAVFDNVLPNDKARYDAWSFRFRPTSAISTSMRLPLGGTQAAGTTTGSGYSLYISGTNCVFSANNATHNLSTTIPALAANTWYHIAVQIDWGSTVNRGANPRVSVWIDGTIRVSNVLTTASFAPLGSYNLSFNTGSSTAYTKYFDDIQIGQSLSAAVTSMTANITPATFDAAVRALGPAVGSSIIFNGGYWVPGTSSSVSVLNDLTDVTLTTPSNGNVLSYNGTQWINTAGPPADLSSSSIDLLSDVNTTSTPPTNGQALLWNGSNWVPGTVSTSSNLDGLTDVTITSAAVGEVLRYNGTAWVDAQLAYTDLSGRPTLATVATTGAYADLSGRPTLATVATTGAYADLSGRPTLATVATSGSYTDLTNKPTIPTSIDNLSDVDTATTAPVTNQVLAWNGTNWVPVNQSAGAGATRTTVTQTTASIANGASANITISGAGRAGSLLSVTTDRAAWVVFYDTIASRSADASRSETTDPSPGSGVLAEIITTGAQTIKTTPVPSYYNGESPTVSAIYAKVVNKSGVTSTVKVDAVVAYYEA